MSLKIIAALILFLTLLTHYIEGYNRDSHANKDLINDDEIRITRSLGNGSGINSHCCITGNCYCPSLDNVLTNLTSNGLINITTNMELLSFIVFADLANITITGHNNPTVNCSNSGGIHFYILPVLQL